MVGFEKKLRFVRCVYIEYIRNTRIYISITLLSFSLTHKRAGEKKEKNGESEREREEKKNIRKNRSNRPVLDCTGLRNM